MKKTHKHAIQKQPLKTFRPDSILFCSLAKGWYVLERVAVASLSLVISTDPRTPLAPFPRSLPRLSPTFLPSVAQYQGCVSLCLQSGHVPEHLTHGLPSMEPMLSPGCAALCPHIYHLSHPRQTRLTDPHHPCSHHRPACLWESLLHTSWSSFQIHLFLTGG